MLRLFPGGPVLADYKKGDGKTEKGAIEFYKKAFGATELFRFPAPGGKIGHAEIKIGDSPCRELRWPGVEVQHRHGYEKRWLFFRYFNGHFW